MALSKTILFLVLGVVSFAAADNCAQDNCYRAFNGAAYTASAQAFCSSFTRSVVTATAELPARASACSGVARVSSVCSCAYPFTTSKLLSSSTVITSAPTTLQTTTSVPAVPAPAYGPGCAADNCLRAFDRGNGGAFCSAFTLGGTAAPTFPSYATMCGANTSSRVSSACTCLNYHSSSTPLVCTKKTATQETTNVSPAPTPAPLPLGCNADNCLRAMKREGGDGITAFCTNFTNDVVTASTALPTYATQCTVDSVSQISSACSCLVPGTATASPLAVSTV